MVISATSAVCHQTPHENRCLSLNKNFKQVFVRLPKRGANKMSSISFLTLQMSRKECECDDRGGGAQEVQK